MDDIIDELIDILRHMSIFVFVFHYLSFSLLKNGPHLWRPLLLKAGEVQAVRNGNFITRSVSYRFDFSFKRLSMDRIRSTLSELMVLFMIHALQCL